MPRRVIDVSQEPYRIKTKGYRLAFGLDGQTVAEVPLCDVVALILAHPHITITLASLARLCEQNIPAIICDDCYAPVGTMCALYWHARTGVRSRRQVEASVPTLKQAWKSIVRKKIENQANVLFVAQKTYEEIEEVRSLAKQVRSGDPDNRESVAAKKYWERLFDGYGFHRDYEGRDPINAGLNYGYAILRATVARSIVAAGLTPCFGMHHHNQYDQFALANDIMEPFRPAVDYAVYLLRQSGRLVSDLTPEDKVFISRHMNGRYHVDGNFENFFEAITKVVESYVRVLEGSGSSLALPSGLPLGIVTSQKPTYLYRRPDDEESPYYRDDDDEDDADDFTRPF